jgi:hypothetical protein
VSKEISGILAFVTMNQTRYLGGQPLSLLAHDETEMLELATAVAKSFAADIVQLPTGDCMVIKK